MNIIRNRFKQFVSGNFYKVHMVDEPVLYIITEGELGDGDGSIGVNAICIDVTPFTGVWRV